MGTDEFRREEQRRQLNRDIAESAERFRRQSEGEVAQRQKLADMRETIRQREREMFKRDIEATNQRHEESKTKSQELAEELSFQRKQAHQANLDRLREKGNWLRNSLDHL